ncbi:hypothetical protein Q666_16605 [Marinobacter sp. ES-1]|nr:hypothetical protein Q666_16605 [Marinobacter sp. ES-1]
MPLIDNVDIHITRETLNAARQNTHRFAEAKTNTDNFISGLVERELKKRIRYPERYDFPFGVSCAVGLQLSRGFRIIQEVVFAMNIAKGKIIDKDIRRAFALPFTLIATNFEHIDIGLDFDIHTKIDPSIGCVLSGVRMVITINGKKGLTGNLRHFLIRNRIQACNCGGRQNQGAGQYCL